MSSYRLDTEITALCGIRLPFIQGGLTPAIATPALVSSISNQGGLGVVNADGQSHAELVDMITATKALTDQPFAIQIKINHQTSRDEVEDETQKIVMEDWLKRYRRQLGISDVMIETHSETALDWHDQVDFALEHEIPVVIFTHGLPTDEVLSRLKANGVAVIATATHLVEALIAEEIGCDAIIAQGMEAGGERATFIGNMAAGMYPLTTLVPLFVDQLSIPVIATGGIGDVRGAYAMFGMGAQAVQMGSLLIPTHESGAASVYKSAVINSLECSTVISRIFTGRPARVLINRLVLDANQIDFKMPPAPIHQSLMRPIAQAAEAQDREDYMPMYAGMGAFMARQTSVTHLIEEWAIALTEPYSEVA